MRTRFFSVLLAMWSSSASCVERGGSHSTLPPAQAFSVPSNFEGEWLGEAAESSGTLRIQRLGEGLYRGVYRAEDQPLSLVLAMEQQQTAGSDGRMLLSNLVSFTWQDGRGGRGRGWLLINREDSALMGAFGRGDDHSNNGEWTFIRLE